MAKREFLQLAHVFDPKKHSVAGWFLSEKLDGLRCFWDGGITRGKLCSAVPWANMEKASRLILPPTSTGLWTRYGHPIMAPGWFIDKLPQNLPLDGELYAGRGMFQTVVSVTKKLTPNDHEWAAISYKVFDLPPYMEIFKDGKINTTNFKKEFEGIQKWTNFPEVRRRSFRDTIDYLNVRHPQLVHRQVVLPYSEAEALRVIDEQLGKVTDGGGEGLMIRHPTAFWEPARSYNMLKVKRLQDAEAVVLGYTSGRETNLGSKHLGKVGALVVGYRDKVFELAGLTDEERIFDSPQMEQYAIDHPGERMPPEVVCSKFPRGTMVTFRYRELTNDGIPKEARYWRKHA